jgi:hypothetical protein
MKFSINIHIKSLTAFVSEYFFHVLTATVVSLFQTFEVLLDKINFGSVCRTTLVIRFSIKLKEKKRYSRSNDEFTSRQQLVGL